MIVITSMFYNLPSLLTNNL